MDLLWSNPNGYTTNAFTTTTVNVSNITQYRFILFITREGSALARVIPNGGTSYADAYGNGMSPTYQNNRNFCIQKEKDVVEC